MKLNDLIKNSRPVKRGVYMSGDKYFSLYANKGNALFWQRGTIEEAEIFVSYAKILTSAQIFTPETEWGIYRLGSSYSIYSVMPSLDPVPQNLSKYGSAEAAERITHYFTKNNVSKEWLFLSDIPDSMSVSNWGVRNGKAFMIDIDALDIELETCAKFISSNKHLFS